jgi:hypothetical protein
MSKATARATRYVRYAMAFVNGSEDDPTDENIAEVLGNCVRPPHPEEYADIRLEVGCWRAHGMTRAEMAELEDERPAWSLTRGDLNRIAGRALSDAEVERAVKAIDGSDVGDTVAGAVVAMVL